MMITTMVHGHADRLRSYELLAEAWDLERDHSEPSCAFACASVNAFAAVIASAGTQSGKGVAVVR